MRGGLLVILVVMLPVSGLADPTLECGTGNRTQVEIRTCVTDMDQRVDIALDIAMTLAIEAATALDEVTGRAVASPALATAQEAWDAYRDAHCAHVGAMYAGGSGSDIAVSACRVNLGRARIDALLAQAE